MPKINHNKFYKCFIEIKKKVDIIISKYLSYFYNIIKYINITSMFFGVFVVYIIFSHIF